MCLAALSKMRILKFSSPPEGFGGNSFWIGFLMLETPFLDLINCVKLESCHQNDTQTCCGNYRGLNSVSKQMHICHTWKKFLWDWYISKRMWIRNSDLAFQSLLSRTKFLSKSDVLKEERYCHNLTPCDFMSIPIQTSS